LKDLSFEQSNNETGAFNNALWLTFALLAVAAIYAYYFIAQGGRDYISPDGVQYLSLARGESANAPYNTRILKPRLAALISSVSGLSHQSAFQLLTPIELFSSLILLARLVKRYGGSTALQCAIVLTFGYGLSAVFGRTPVLVDTTLLFLTCLFLAALEVDLFVAALACACLAVLTKEYGALLAAVWAIEAVRRRRVIFAAVGVALLGAVFIVNKQMISGTVSGDFFTMLVGAMRYTAGVLSGANGYKAAYFWLWAALWPLVLVASLSVVANLVRHGKIGPRHWAFVIALPFVPLLLTGDWDRSLMIVVPFACMVAASHQLATDYTFLLLVTSGGLATALARPAATPIPAGLRIALMTASLLSTLGLVLMVAGYCLRQIKITGIVSSPEEKLNESLIDSAGKK